MKVLFVAGFGPLVAPGQSEPAGRFYEETLGLTFQREGEYRHTNELSGVMHFALWPLQDAAESCFQETEWPDHLPTPQAWIVFEVENVAAATEELRGRGYPCLVETRTEPWGQIVSRLLGPEGMLVGLTYTPWLRDKPAD
jgi:hypothetical protein